jgi:F-type H+-transporting ATPase subunit epsilon
MDGVIHEGKVDFAVVNTYDGEMGFLYNHAPLISELGFGEARLYIGDDVKHLVVEGGFVEIRQNEMIILAETAIKKENLSAPDLQKKFNEMASMSKPQDPRERLLLEVELKRLKARLKVVSR